MTVKTLILGGSGHVSGAVARTALAAGHRVWTVTRGERPLPDGVTPLIADRKDNDALTKAVTEAGVHWDLVVDCICYDLPEIRQDIALFRERAAHLVLVSTDFVYDPVRRSFPQPEDTDAYVTGTEGSQGYGRKKRLCELELASADTGDMRWTVVRPCHIYGPTSELGCLPEHGRDRELIERLQREEPLRLVGGGHFLQQPILAEDLAHTIVSVAETPGCHRGIYNTAGPDILESREYYRIIADVLGVPLKIEELPVDAYAAEHPERAPFLCHRIYDLKALRESGLNVPATAIKEGLRLHTQALLERRNRG
jgi:nucleoside-diphosphate-sugar epimerase